MSVDEVKLVLRIAGEQAIAKGHRLLDPRSLADACGADGLTNEEYLAAIQALAEQRVINVHLFRGVSITLLRLTENGFALHLQASRTDLDAVRARVGTALETTVSEGQLGTVIDLAGALGEPPLVVETLLDELRDRGDLVFSLVAGRRVRIHRVGPFVPFGPLSTPDIQGENDT